MTALIAIVAALFGGLLWAGRRRRLAAYSCFNQAVYDADTVCDDNSCDSYDDAEAFCSDDDRDDFGERLLERLIRIGRPRRLMHASSGRTSGPDRGVQVAEFASNTQRQRAILAQLMQHPRRHSYGRRQSFDIIAAARRQQRHDQRHRSSPADLGRIASLPGAAFRPSNRLNPAVMTLVFSIEPLPSIAASTLMGKVRFAPSISVRPGVSLKD